MPGYLWLIELMDFLANRVQTTAECKIPVKFDFGLIWVETRYDIRTGVSQLPGELKTSVSAALNEMFAIMYFL